MTLSTRCPHRGNAVDCLWARNPLIESASRTQQGLLMFDIAARNVVSIKAS
jgi:hypothetical protein